MTNLERGWAPLRGVIVGHEKYIDLPIPELYDLTADPGEARNLARDRAERATVLRGVLSQFPSLVAAPVAERPDVEARLRSLGYVGSSGAARRDRYTERDDPKNLIAVDRRMQEATAAYTSGRTDEAIAMLRSVIADWPDNAEAYLDLAVASWHADRQADAIATLEDAITRGLPQPALRTKLGLCLALSGDGRRAIPLLERASQDDVETLNALGLAYAQVGRRADAIRTFERALVLDPTSGLALENIATVHITAGALGPAETALRKALALDDTLTGARTQLGGVLAATGRRDDAIATWVDAANRDPEAYEALYNAAVALVQGGRRDAAQPYVDRFLRTAPPSRYGRQIEQLRTLR
jgi:tetratricopeptide (TPR) repeat protein